MMQILVTVVIHLQSHLLGFFLDTGTEEMWFHLSRADNDSNLNSSKFSTKIIACITWTVTSYSFQMLRHFVLNITVLYPLKQLFRAPAFIQEPHQLRNTIILGVHHVDGGSEVWPLHCHLLDNLESDKWLSKCDASQVLLQKIRADVGWVPHLCSHCAC